MLMPEGKSNENKPTSICMLTKNTNKIKNTNFMFTLVMHKTMDNTSLLKPIQKQRNQVRFNKIAIPQNQNRGSVKRQQKWENCRCLLINCKVPPNCKVAEEMDDYFRFLNVQPRL